MKSLQGKLELAIATAALSDGDESDNGPLIVMNDVTDIDEVRFRERKYGSNSPFQVSHSESDWENEFTGEVKGGSESENEAKRRKTDF